MHRRSDALHSKGAAGQLSWLRFSRFCEIKTETYIMDARPSTAIPVSCAAKESRSLIDLYTSARSSRETRKYTRSLTATSPSNKRPFYSPSIPIVQAALDTGAMGYVVKTDVDDELVIAIDAVFKGKQFISKRILEQSTLCGECMPMRRLCIRVVWKTGGE